MDDEIRYFLENNEEENEISVKTKYKSKPLTAMQKVTGSVFIIVILILTTLLGVQLRTNNNSPETTVATISDKAEDASGISKRIKIKTFELFIDNTLVLRGRLNITKDDLKTLSKSELNELFEYISTLGKYSWITICFSDGTGIVALPDNKSTYFYGKLDENSLISSAYGTIIKDGNDSYVFIESAQNELSVTDETTSDSIELNSGSVYITASGTKYHKSDCSYLSDTKVAITLSKAKEQGYLPCSRCIN